MKTILIAAVAALSFVTPAAAQPAQPPQPPAATCTPEHAAMGHCTLPAQPSQPQSHQGHGHAQDGEGQTHGQMSECCRDANGNGRMDCCENMAAAGQRPCCAQHQQPGQPATQQSAPAQPQAS
jgi:hypothetical protein